VKLQHLYPLLRELNDARFHSGEALAQRLGLTRAAIWKQVQALNRYPGVGIRSVRGKGYLLDPSLQLLDQQAIEVRLPDRAGQHLRELHILAETHSTNDWLRDRLPSHLHTGHACIAEYQHAARGRRGRRWECSVGSNIYLSLAWRFDLGMADLAGLSLAVGVSLARTLRELGLETLGLKWPNDLYLDDRKLGGILVEASGEIAGPALAIVGVGINIRLGEENARAIEQPWIDMASVLQATPDRNRLAGDLLAGLLDTCLIYQKQGLTPFLEEWKKYDIYMGQEVVLHMGSQEITGTYCGLDERGGLVLRNSGGRRSWYAGEVSLRSVRSQ